MFIGGYTRKVYLPSFFLSLSQVFFFILPFSFFLSFTILSFISVFLQKHNLYSIIYFSFFLPFKRKVFPYRFLLFAHALVYYFNISFPSFFFFIWVSFLPPLNTCSILSFSFSPLISNPSFYFCFVFFSPSDQNLLTLPSILHHRSNLFNSFPS